MLFNKRKCHQCNNEYDIALSNCPHCKANNPIYSDNNKGNDVLWFDLLTQISFFLIGFAGIYAVVIFCQSILSIFISSESDLFSILVNTISYFSLSIIFFFILFYQRNIFKNAFKKPINIVWGIVFGIILISFSLLYANLINIIHPITDNDNQKEAIKMITYTPALAIIVLGLLGPICEEITYRLGLFNIGLRINKVVAFIVVPIIFGLIHFNFFAGDIVNELLNLPSYVIAGLILCFTYYKFGFIASTTAHIVNNLFSVIVLMIGNL